MKNKENIFCALIPRTSPAISNALHQYFQYLELSKSLEIVFCFVPPPPSPQPPIPLYWPHLKFSETFTCDKFSEKDHFG